ncbi:MAG: hypothetical protein EOP06_11595 [Proteobacteria bacterium]|nr:MAG: hypothetical protein EOP06_11595 [Pseudomonadota bacterium]
MPAHAVISQYHGTMTIRFGVLFLFLFGLIGFAEARPAPKMKALAKTLKPDSAWVERKLARMGFSKGFIKEAVASYEPESFEKTLTLNLLGFLRAPGQHMNLVTPQSVRESTQFILKNKTTFEQTEMKYDVPANVIAALLWIETRHGEDVGTFHTASVYLHLLQADLSANKKVLAKLALEKNKEERNYTPKALRKLMGERTKKKALWAEEQLIALAAARKEKHLNLKELRGSYAGAFGLPQFIPSSYRSFAQTLEPQSTPDLDTIEDAIVSVGYYLSKHGWKNQEEESKVTALMKYNNSRDYADSILEISRRVLDVSPSTKKSRAVSSSE